MNKEISISSSLKYHYENLAESLINRSVVTFLGADINLCDRPEEEKNISNPWGWNPDDKYPPTYLEIAAYIDEKLSRGHRHSKYLEDIKCPLCNPNTIPNSCPALKREVNRLALQHVSQYFWLTIKNNKKQEQKFRDCINKIYNPDKRPKYKTNCLHRFLASLPRFVKNYSTVRPSPSNPSKPYAYPLIVTTCFDRMLEKAFEDAKQSFDLVFFTKEETENKTGQPWMYQKYDYEHGDNNKSLNPKNVQKITELENNYQWLQERPVILRLCNPVNYLQSGENFNITEDNFLDFLIADFIDELPAKIQSALHNSSSWFLGYSPSYWNLRGILHRIAAPVKKSSNQQEELETSTVNTEKTLWAVQEKPEILDEKFWLANEAEFLPEDDDKNNFSLEAYIHGLEWHLQKTYTN